MVVMSQLLHTVANAVQYTPLVNVTLPHPQLYVASCPDLTLRVFSKHFELLGTVNVTGTILR